jgi:hypothetical protein
MRLSDLFLKKLGLVLVVALVFAAPAWASPAMSSVDLESTSAEAALAALFPKPEQRTSTYFCEVEDPCNPGSTLCGIQCNVGQSCFCLHALGQTQNGCYVLWVRPARCI